MMIGSLLLLAAVHSAQPVSAEPPPVSAAKFVPASGATERATASVRIISGISFGHGRSAQAPGALHRHARIIDREGQIQPAELLEFQ